MRLKHDRPSLAIARPTTTTYESRITHAEFLRQFFDFISPPGRHPNNKVITWVSIVTIIIVCVLFSPCFKEKKRIRIELAIRAVLPMSGSRLTLTN